MTSRILSDNDDTLPCVTLDDTTSEYVLEIDRLTKRVRELTLRAEELETALLHAHSEIAFERARVLDVERQLHARSWSS